MEYRLSKNKTEIVKTLADNLTAGCSLTVWQKQSDGSRSFLQEMTFETLYADEGVFTLHENQKNFNSLDPKKEVYFLLAGHNCTFKTKMAIDQKEFLTLQIPRSVRLQELRVHERKYFQLEDKKLAEVIFVIKNSDNKISLTCPVLNFSESGVCIVVSKETISNIDFTADVLLKMSNNFQKAVILNARIFIKKNLNNDELYALGIKL